MQHREREKEKGETKFAVGAMKERCSKACAKTETVQLVQQLIIITYTSNKYLLYLVAVPIIILITYVHNIAQVVTAAGMYVCTHCIIILIHHSSCSYPLSLLHLVFFCFFQPHVNWVSMPITKHFASYD